MTANQIAYWANVENKRSHMANEELKGRELEETSLHNRNTEAHNTKVLAETARHNVASEGIEKHKADSQRISANANMVSSTAKAAESATKSIKNLVSLF